MTSKVLLSCSTLLFEIESFTELGALSKLVIVKGEAWFLSWQGRLEGGSQGAGLGAKGGVWGATNI